jgi:multidrug efflux system membrane fusion protein
MYVYVVNSDGTVQSRPVTTATALNGITVVSKGLAPGETVVTDGQLALFNGAKVMVRGGKPAAAGAGVQAQ